MFPSWWWFWCLVCVASVWVLWAASSFTCVVVWMPGFLSGLFVSLSCVIAFLIDLCFYICCLRLRLHVLVWLGGCLRLVCAF